jgi:hypothetical protein
MLKVHVTSLTCRNVVLLSQLWVDVWTSVPAAASCIVEIPGE